MQMVGEHMKNTAGLFISIFFTLVLVTGCSGDESSSSNAAAEDVNPCDVIGDDFLRSHFNIADGVVIEHSISKYSRHPLCTASWRKANADELEKQSSAALLDYFRQKSQGKDVKMPSIKSTNEVSLTLNKPFFENASAAQAMLDSSMETLQQGITREHKGVKVTFQADIVPIEGVGDKAAWAASLHQLSVADGRRLFHLTVNTGADAEHELGKAKAMAKELADIL
jgi:hypothetical protein